MGAEPLEYPVNSVRVLLNDDRTTSGKICSVALEHDIEFNNQRELVGHLDLAFDTIGQPQPYQVMRTFGENEKNYKSYNGHPTRYHSSEEIRQRKGMVKTFDVIMVSRRHAEWQGLIKDESGQVVLRFNSTLEFLKIFN